MPDVKLICSPQVATTWSQMLNEPEKLLQVANGFGVLIAAMAALFTLFFVGLKGINSQWNASFRDLYDEFWTDASIAVAQKYIIYDHEYQKIKGFLSDVAGEEPSAVEFTEHQIETIEFIDRLFAKCTEFTLLSKRYS